MKYKILIALASLIFCSCVQKMGTDGHLRPLGGTSYSLHPSRQPPEGAIPQNRSDEEIEQKSMALVKKIPVPITKRLLKQGQEQFNIYCMPCHGPSGYGNGMIVQRGFLAPPSYHQDRLRQAPDGHFFDVITRGFGAMYSYADRVEVSDRWAIVAYIRALQLSQNSKASEIPSAEYQKLKKEAHG